MHRNSHNIFLVIYYTKIKPITIPATACNPARSHDAVTEIEFLVRQETV